MRACTSIQIPEHGEVENVEKESLSTETPFRGAEANQTLAASLQSQEHLVTLSQKLLDQLAPCLGNVERSTFCDWVSSVLHEMEPGKFRASQKEITSILLKYMGPATPPVQHSTQRAASQTTQVDTSFQPQPGTSQEQMDSSPNFDLQWQPHPSQWPRQVPPVSVCSSMESRYMHQAMPEFYNCPSSCPPNSTPSQVSTSLNLLSPLLNESPTFNVLQTPVPQQTKEQQQQPPVQLQQTQTDRDQ